MDDFMFKRKSRPSTCPAATNASVLFIVCIIISNGICVLSSMEDDLFSLSDNLPEESNKITLPFDDGFVILDLPKSALNFPKQHPPSSNRRRQSPEPRRNTRAGLQRSQTLDRPSRLRFIPNGGQSRWRPMNGNRQRNRSRIRYPTDNRDAPAVRKNNNNQNQNNERRMKKQTQNQDQMTLLIPAISQSESSIRVNSINEQLPSYRTTRTGVANNLLSPVFVPIDSNFKNVGSNLLSNDVLEKILAEVIPKIEAEERQKRDRAVDDQPYLRMMTARLVSSVRPNDQYNSKPADGLLTQQSGYSGPAPRSPVQSIPRQQPQKFNPAPRPQPAVQQQQQQEEPEQQYQEPAPIQQQQQEEPFEQQKEPDYEQEPEPQVQQQEPVQEQEPIQQQKVQEQEPEPYQPPAPVKGRPPPPPPRPQPPTKGFSPLPPPPPAKGRPAPRPPAKGYSPPPPAPSPPAKGRPSPPPPPPPRIPPPVKGLAPRPQPPTKGYAPPPPAPRPVLRPAPPTKGYSPPPPPPVKGRPAPPPPPRPVPRPTPVKGNPPPPPPAPPAVKGRPQPVYQQPAPAPQTKGSPVPPPQPQQQEYDEPQQQQQAPQPPGKSASSPAALQSLASPLSTTTLLYDDKATFATASPLRRNAPTYDDPNADIGFDDESAAFSEEDMPSKMPLDDESDYAASPATSSRLRAGNSSRWRDDDGPRTVAPIRTLPLSPAKRARTGNRNGNLDSSYETTSSPRSRWLNSNSIHASGSVHEYDKSYGDRLRRESVSRSNRYTGDLGGESSNVGPDKKLDSILDSLVSVEYAESKQDVVSLEESQDERKDVIGNAMQDSSAATNSSSPDTQMTFYHFVPFSSLSSSSKTDSNAN